MQFQFDHDIDSASASAGSRWYPPDGFDGLCKFIGFEQKNTPGSGPCLCWHFEVHEGPLAGRTFAMAYVPNKQTIKSKAYAYAEVKRCVGAVYGLDKQAADQITSREINATMGPGMFVGRVVRVRSFAVQKKDGTPMLKQDYYPHLVNGQTVDAPGAAPVFAAFAAAAPVPAYAPPAAAFQAPGAPVPAAPVPPPAPPVVVDHKARALSAGWQPHPTVPGWYFLGSVVKSEAEIVAGSY